MGCCGSKTNNRFVLGLYLIIVGTIALAMIVGGGYMMGADAEVSISSLWSELENDVKVSIQDEFGCCGLYDPDATGGEGPGTPCPEPTSSATYEIDTCMNLLISSYEVIRPPKHPNLCPGLSSTCFFQVNVFLLSVFIVFFP